jgi:hypothetical protein
MARLIVAPRPAVMMRDRLLRLDQHDHRRGNARRQTAKPLEALAPLEISVFTSLGQGLSRAGPRLVGRPSFLTSQRPKQLEADDRRRPLNKLSKLSHLGAITAGRHASGPTNAKRAAEATLSHEPDFQ